MIATLYANTAEPWPLREGTVHVWRFANHQDPGSLASVLSPDEVVAANRFYRQLHRDRYVVQHSMIRCLLARYLDREPQTIAFERGKRGKPFLADGGGLEFNLSHADDVALLAVAREIQLGVDLERFDATLDVDKLAPIVLAPDEQASRSDKRAFLRIWCRKEAALKATGIGLVDDLTSVSVFAERTEITGVAVEVRDLFVSETHAAALAMLVTSTARADVGSTPLEDFVTS